MATAVEVLQATTMALTSRSASRSSDWVEKARTSSSERHAVRRPGVVAEVDRRFARRAADDLAQDRQATDPGVEDPDRTRVGHRGLRTARPRPPTRPELSSSPAIRMTSLLIWASGLASTNGHALVVRLDDEPPVGHDLVLGHAPERALEVERIDAARRIGAVDQVADLGCRVADRAERVGHRDRVVDRRRVVGDDLDDRVGRVEEREVDVVEMARHVDDDGGVDAAQQRQRLLDVARGEHLGHLDARRGEQDVDARRIAPQDVAQVRLGDPVGRQVEDRRRVDRDLEQRAQVAELEAAVDEHGPLVVLAERHGEVERDRRLADAALGREHAHDPRAGDRGHDVELLAHRRTPGSSGRSPRTASTGRRGSRHRCRPRSGSAGTVRTMTGTPSPASWIASTSLGPLSRPWRRASTSTTSGRSSRIVPIARVPSSITSSSLTRRLRVEQAADVLRDLRNVLDDEQADLVSR